MLFISLYNVDSIQKRNGSLCLLRGIRNVAYSIVANWFPSYFYTSNVLAAISVNIYVMIIDFRKSRSLGH